MTVAPRRPGEVGLYLWITTSEELHRLALGQADHGPLPVRPAHLGLAATLDLPVARHRAHAEHLDAEELLDRAPDLHLVGVGRDHEGVGVVAGREVGALLGDERA